MMKMKNKLLIFLLFCLPLFAEENKAEKQQTYPIYCTAVEKGFRTCWINAGKEGMIKFYVPCACEPCEVKKPTKRKKRIDNLPKGKVVNL